MTSSTSQAGSRATSRSLLERVRARDMQAWDRLVALYAPFVYHYCRRARLGPEDAADVFQEVFRAAFAKIASFEKRGPSDTFRGWLLTITKNKVRDHFRRQKRQPRAVGGTEIQVRMAAVHAHETESTTEAADTVAEQRLFATALAGIRPEFQERTWQAFFRTVVDGRPTADIAEELEMSVGAVRVARSRVLRRLRDELGD